MTQGVLPYLDHLIGYYGQPAQVATRSATAQRLPNLPVPTFAPVIATGGAGGGYANPNVHVVANTPEAIRALRENQGQDQQESRGNLAAVVGGIATIALAGVAALAGRGLTNASRDLKKAVAFREQELPRLSQLDQNQLRPILNKHIEVLESKAFWSKNFVGLTVAGLATAVAAFAGGMFTMPWLVTASVVAGVAIAATGVFSGVWYFTEDHNLPPGMVAQIQALRSRYV